MVLKRKRSESELSLASSASSSTFSSPTRPFGLTTSLPTMPSSRNFSAPAHLPSRTMKRFRDSRPSEEMIHQRTLNMLYSAAQNKQQQQHQYQHHREELPQQQQQHTESEQKPQQQQQQQQQQQASLHNFWKLPPTSSASLVAPTGNGFAAQLPTPSSSSSPTSCEDCGQSLGGGGGGVDDDSMDIDGDFDGSGGGTSWSCSTCSKHVCSHCSITNLGEQRRCLSCASASRRVAVSNSGGLRWPSASAAGVGVGVC